MPTVSIIDVKSAQFHDPLPACERLLDSRPLGLESGQQRHRSAIPDADPQQAAYISEPVCEVERILIFAHDYS